MTHQKLIVKLDAVLLKAYEHSRGRPSKTDEIQIELELRPYFINSTSPYITSQKTSYDIKTVRRYFEKFKVEMFDSTTPEFLQRCREEKERCFLSCDDMLTSLYEDKDEVTRLIQVAKKQGDLSLVDKLYKTKLKINEQIGYYHSAKIELATYPTPDIENDLQKRGEKIEN